MGLICNFDTQETDEGLKELAQIDYNDREYKSRVSDNTWDDSIEEDDGLLERNGNPRREEFQFPFYLSFPHDTTAATLPISYGLLSFLALLVNPKL